MLRAHGYLHFHLSCDSSLHGRHPRPRSSSSSTTLVNVGRRGGRSSLLFQTRATGSNYGDAALISRTQDYGNISTSAEVGGAGGGYSYDALKRLDNLLYNICHTTSNAKDKFQVVFSFPNSSGRSYSDEIFFPTFDILVCGGTLGIFFALALASKGLKVGVVEKNLLKGREQEWNISKKELMELVHAGVLSEEDIDHVTSAKFNPNRCGFEGKGEIWVEDVLNLGVLPAKLLEIVKRRFLSLGGVIFEGSGISKICIYNDAAILHLSNGKVLSSRLVIDAMGNFSPIVKQIRSGKKPDGICLVVGSCSRGFKENSKSDVIFSSASVRTVGASKLQYFWEAFPAGSGSTDRTTYMFTYVDAQPGCPKVEDLLEDYWNLMPEYQGVVLEELEVLRVIFGIFPTYRESPLPAAFDRVIQIGDASGIQSPVSFGGFGSMTRHLKRLSTGIHEAVMGDFLDARSLSLLNPYMPNLRASWLFQRAMSAQKHSSVSSTFINDLLHANFISMQSLGDPVLRPFLQDVIQFGPLVKTLGLVVLTQPGILPSIFSQIGLGVILDWSVHFFMLGQYTLLSKFVDPAIRPWIEGLPEKERFHWRRRLEAWKYGSGLDYEL
ncbi:unnamed protein product [Spirodela intermedia]|uniref:Uncharacterized protein n=1 Tax=Spirodela intermedia TaxID=51605 RepID=A0A7I8IW88_SPIIN|nr:unnamed protein product [Spirodela intermedia]CAA6661411.1 unnamed protein product [Spirodela intermedia]